MGINVKLLVQQSVVLFVVFALALFIPAGTLAWPAGWVYLFLLYGFVAALDWWMLKHNPGLLKEVMGGIIQAGQNGWEKLLMGSLQTLIVGWFILMALDAVRFHGSRMTVWIQVLGAIILLCSYYLFFTTFRENSYLSPVVRIQTDRGHKVVSTGPYHYVRHPMYTGIVLFSLGTPLLLGSWYGLVFALILVSIMARRAVLEERTLRDELAGYTAYMTQVKYRFIPHVW